MASTSPRGNEVWADGTPVVGVRASRDPLELSEDSGDDRDQLLGRWVYFLPAEEGPLALTGRDVIEDGGERFHVIGDPDHVRRRRGGRVHHVEAIAERRD